MSEACRNLRAKGDVLAACRRGAPRTRVRAYAWPPQNALEARGSAAASFRLMALAPAHMHTSSALPDQALAAQQLLSKHCRAGFHAHVHCRGQFLATSHQCSGCLFSTTIIGNICSVLWMTGLPISLRVLSRPAFGPTTLPGFEPL